MSLVFLISDSFIIDLIVDNCINLQSFECVCVVFVRNSGGDSVPYNAISRARTKCIVVDIATNAEPLTMDQVDFLSWKVDPAGGFLISNQ